MEADELTRQAVATVRLIPWHRIEIIHLLPEDTDWKADVALDKKGDLVLNNRHKMLVADGTIRGRDR